MPADLTEARAVDLRGARDVAATWSVDDLAYARNTRPHRLTSESVTMLALHDALAEVDRLTAELASITALLDGEDEVAVGPVAARVEEVVTELADCRGLLDEANAERDAAYEAGRQDGWTEVHQAMRDEATIKRDIQRSIERERRERGE